MKFKFKIQDYQTEAVNAVVKVFEGQNYNDKVTYLRDMGRGHAHTLFEDDSNGFGNSEVELSDEMLLENIRMVQTENNIELSSSLSKNYGKGCKCSLDIEMETGTGKTYCYIKSIFELNKKYGWSKFIVIVPSIAIREGVKKSFEMTQDHFYELYNKKARFFIYNSKNLNQLDKFSSGKDIYVMIINSQAFASSLKEGANNKESRIIYNKQDSFGSRRPIDVIAANRPIIILDEPQKLGGKATTDGIKLFKPLFTLNYSATHKDTHNLVYVLDALNAYQKRLVKKIEVKGFELRNLRGTEGYIYLSKIILDAVKPPSARIEFEINYSKGINRETRILKKGDNLYDLSAGKGMPPLEEYKNGYVISEIDGSSNTVTLLNGLRLTAGEVYGNRSEKDLRRIQIRETIASHFEKEEKLFNRGIKCLSLFFIDEVAHYRKYDEDGDEQLGDYGIIFEQEYNSLLNEYITLGNTPYIEYLKKIEVKNTHKGYFSIDKKGRAVNSIVNRKGECDDMSAYDLILKNKERLLSFEEPTRFIFSHSALREGWDNPNVFQICTLKNSDSEISKRQEVGRGMRLCVNKDGDRMDSSVADIKVHDINVLTVIASESYKKFVDGLQTEIKADLYQRPEKATSEYFKGKIVKDTDGAKHELTKDEANIIERWLAVSRYIDLEGNITDTYRAAKEKGVFSDLPEKLAPYAESIVKLIDGIYDKKALDELIGNASVPVVAENNLTDNFYKKEFQTLWKHINHKYAYTVSFDSDELVKNAIKDINMHMSVTKLTYVRTTGSQRVDDLDFTAGRTRTETLTTRVGSGIKYDLVGKIAQGTNLMRKTIVKILKGIEEDKFNMFKNNPEEFISKAIEYINNQKAAIIVEEIKYDITHDEPYSSDIFNMGKGSIAADRVMIAKKHITPYIVFDSTSDTERIFAKDIEADEDNVCVYAKLPHSFKIPTPVGDYTPDWAIAFYEGKVKYVYFIAETKGNLDSLQLRAVEKAKINCARKLFAKLDSGAVRYGVADTYQHLLDIIIS